MCISVHLPVPSEPSVPLSLPRRTPQALEARRTGAYRDKETAAIANAHYEYVLVPRPPLIMILDTFIQHTQSLDLCTTLRYILNSPFSRIAHPST